MNGNRITVLSGTKSIVIRGGGGGVRVSIIQICSDFILFAISIVTIGLIGCLSTPTTCKLLRIDVRHTAYRTLKSEVVKNIARLYM